MVHLLPEAKKVEKHRPLLEELSGLFVADRKDGVVT